MKLNLKQETDYPFHAAGSIWIIPTVQFVELPDGKTGLQQSEIRRVHAAIANQICGRSSPLTGRELEFLCSITVTRLVDLSSSLGVNKSTVSRWKRTEGELSLLVSDRLKKYFWFKLFGDRMAETDISLNVVADEADLLEFVASQAVQQNLTVSVQRMAA